MVHVPLDARQHVVELVPTGYQLNLGRISKGFLGLTAKGMAQRVAEQGAGPPDGLARLPGEPLPFLGCGPVPVAQLEPVSYQHAQHVRQQPQPAFLAEHDLRTAEEVHAADRVADSVGGHAEQAQRVGIRYLLRGEP